MKGPYEDVILRDPVRARIDFRDDENLETLAKIGDMVGAMGKGHGTGKKRNKELSTDTARAFAHTCRGLIEMSKYLIEHKLRQGSGGCYFITEQQIMEKVAIFKTRL